FELPFPHSPSARPNEESSHFQKRMPAKTKNPSILTLQSREMSSRICRMCQRICWLSGASAWSFRSYSRASAPLCICSKMLGPTKYRTPKIAPPQSAQNCFNINSPQIPSLGTWEGPPTADARQRPKNFVRVGDQFGG